MTTALLDERYGRTSARAKRGWLIGFGALGAAVVVGLSWVTIQSSIYNVSVDGLGFSVVDERSVEVDFQFSAKPGAEVTCALSALDEEMGIVGYNVVRFSDFEGHSHKVHEVIRTVGLATTGTVDGCWIS